MKVLVVGSGAREHALGWKLRKSAHVSQLFFAPGNAGTASIGTNLPVPADALEELATKAQLLGTDLTVVGPEAPLAEGLVDIFAARGLRVFGPSRAAAQIEASKAYARELMASAGVPGPRFGIFDQPGPALSYIERSALPLVVKADGLAAGKGARVCLSRQEAFRAVEEIMVERRFGPAGTKVIIEDFLEGKEASALAFVSTDQVALMPLARDYKRLMDGDQGPNTGGMGSICPIPEDAPHLRDLVLNQVFMPTVRAMMARGVHYTGILYAGLMLTPEGPKVLEFNCRFGDPEAQSLLPLLASDLLEAVEACLAGHLYSASLRWVPRHACAVVLASSGYPDSYATGVPIAGLDKLPAQDRWAFHGGTKVLDGQVVTAGGRVLTVTAVGDTAAEARRKAYEGVGLVSFHGMHLRRDIGL